MTGGSVKSLVGIFYAFSFARDRRENGPIHFQRWKYGSPCDEYFWTKVEGCICVDLAAIMKIGKEYY